MVEDKISILGDSFEHCYEPLSWKDKKAKSYHYCRALVFLDLLNPWWAFVSCAEKLLFNVVCKVASNKHLTRRTRTITPDTKLFSKAHIIRNKTAFRFHWQSIGNFTGNCSVPVEGFETLFKAVSTSQFPPFISGWNEMRIIVRILRYGDIFQFQRLHSTTDQEGCCIQAQNLGQYEIKLNVHNCFDQAQVSAQFVCDEQTDCPLNHPSDESLCSCDDTNNQWQVFKQSPGTLYLCKQAFLNMNNFHPLVPNGTLQQNSGHLADAQTNMFYCKDRSSISQALVNDLVVDCYPTGEDEDILLSITQNKTFYSCGYKYQIPCRDGHVKCFNISEICIYKLNQLGHLLPCRTGQHLQECRELECNTMFKCLHHYCVPWMYVCNGKWDCPHGADEHPTMLCSQNNDCRNLFRCRNSVVCVHTGDVCDDKADCPANDDEQLCKLKGISCPPKCHCLTFSAICENLTVSWTQYHHLKFSKVLFMTNISFSSQLDLSQHTLIHIERSSFFLLCDTLKKGSQVQTLYVMQSNISQLPRFCFKRTKHIEIIDISRNLVSVVEEMLFANLSLLKSLNLSSNPIAEFQSNSFTNLPNLRIISVQDLNISKADKNIFMHMALAKVETNNPAICCLAPEPANCSTSIPWFFGCSGLLPNVSLQATVGTVAFLTLMLGVISLVLQLFLSRKERIKQKEKSGVFSAMLVSINFSDLACALSLVLVFFFDLKTADHFIFQKEVWGSSFECTLLFATFFQTSFSSPLFRCALAILRFVMVAAPMMSNVLRTSFAIKLSTGISSFCLILSVLLSSLINTLEKDLLESIFVCFPFVDASKQIIIVKIATIFVIVLQFSATILVIVCRIGLFVSLKKSQSAVSRKQRNTAIAVQVIILSGSNLVCWIPCCVVYLLCLIMKQYPVDMVYWTIAAVFPLNSVLNSLVFIGTDIRKHIKAQSSKKLP